MATFTLAYRKLTSSTPENLPITPDPPEFNEENVMYIASMYEFMPPSEDEPFNIKRGMLGLNKNI